MTYTHDIPAKGGHDLKSGCFRIWTPYSLFLAKDLNVNLLLFPKTLPKSHGGETRLFANTISNQVCRSWASLSIWVPYWNPGRSGEKESAVRGPHRDDACGEVVWQRAGLWNEKLVVQLLVSIRKLYRGLLWHSECLCNEYTDRTLEFGRSDCEALDSPPALSPCMPALKEWSCKFTHSFRLYFYSTSSSPLLLRGIPDTARILCWSFTPKHHR